MLSYPMRRLIFGLALLPTVAIAQFDELSFCEDVIPIASQSDRTEDELSFMITDIVTSELEPLFVDEAFDAELQESLIHHATVQIAMCFVVGPSDSLDVERAMTILEASADAGYSPAIHQLASLRVFMSDNGELQRSGFLALKREADAGSAYSAGKLGHAYALGRGTERNVALALEHYTMAANAGMTSWQYELAHVYEQGYFGLAIDRQQADYWRNYQPKVHLEVYECVVANGYARGTFPENREVQEEFAEACQRAAQSE